MSTDLVVNGETFTEWQLAEQAIDLATAPVLLYGPPATGKSYLARTFGNTNGRVIPVTCTEGMTDSKLLGHWIQSADDSGSSIFAWHDGPLVRAWREGGRLVLDEIDKLTAVPETGAEGALYSILDSVKSAELMLANGETIRPADTFRVVATSNLGPDVLPDAIRSRMAVSLPITTVNPAAIEQLAPDVRDLAAALATAPASERIDLRAWIEFDSLRGRADSIELAAALAFHRKAEQVLDALRIAEGAGHGTNS